MPHPPASPALDAAPCRDASRRCLESVDHAEGRRAFMEGRKPQLRGC